VLRHSSEQAQLNQRGRSVVGHVNLSFGDGRTNIDVPLGYYNQSVRLSEGV
jgi:hypothetical protein